MPIITITDSDVPVEAPRISQLTVCPKVRFEDVCLQKCEGEALKVKTDDLDSEFGYIFTLVSSLVYTYFFFINIFVLNTVG